MPRRSQVRLNHAQGDGVGTQGPTWTTPISGHGQQFDICFTQHTHTHAQPVLAMFFVFVFTQCVIVNLFNLKGNINKQHLYKCMHTVTVNVFYCALL